MTTMTGILEFYQCNNADVLESLDGDGAGTLWTIPPCSPTALQQGIKQLRRCKATRIRWTRRLALHSRREGEIQAVGVYTLPEWDQHVYQLDSGRELAVAVLSDECVMVARAEF